MLRVHFTGDDFARTRLGPDPAPLVELKLSLMMLQRSDSHLVFGRWRRRMHRTLPASTRPLWDLVSAYRGPSFLDPVTRTLPEGLDAVRNAPRETVREGIERVYAQRPSPPPVWLDGLLRRDPRAYTVLEHALSDAYSTILRASWPAVQRMHRAELARYALAAAESGVGSALTDLVPGSRLVDGVWELGPHYHREIHLRGRGLILLPTFHWTSAPLTLDEPDQPVLLIYPAGSGMPPADANGRHDPLGAVLGNTRARLLRLLVEEHTTSEVAHLAGISLSSASEHTAALRAAGLITTSRIGAAAHHHRTALGTLLMR